VVFSGRAPAVDGPGQWPSTGTRRDRLVQEDRLGLWCVGGRSLAEWVDQYAANKREERRPSG
jgi:hypothetical protein